VLSFLVAFECWTTAASASVRAVANETGIASFGPNHELLSTSNETERHG